MTLLLTASKYCVYMYNISLVTYYVPLGNQEDSVLIELIHELIGLATCQQNPAAAQQAAGCLGEIGPANLHTIAIKVGGEGDKQSGFNHCWVRNGLL